MYSHGFTLYTQAMKRKHDEPFSRNPKKGASSYPRDLSTQEDLYKIVMQALHNRSKDMFFVEGPAGTGKSHLLKKIITDAKDQGFSVAVVASTGVAAVEIGGVTVQSLLGDPRSSLSDRNSAHRTRLHANSAHRTRLHAPSSGASTATPIRVDLLVWDDVNMSDVSLLARVDSLLQKIRNNSAHFGGTIVLFAGDMRGLLPPRKKLCAFYWKDWPRVRKFHLTHNVRIADCDFARELLLVGGFDLLGPCSSMKEFAELDSSMFVDSGEKLIRETFSGCFDRDYPRQDPSRRVILTVTNEDSYIFNEKVLMKLNRKDPVFRIRGETKPSRRSDDHLLRRMEAATPNEAPSHILSLKIGVHVVLLKHIKCKAVDLCLGTVLSVDGITDNHLYCSVRNGPNTGISVTIEKSTDTFSMNNCPFRRTQFPVRLCYARTVHKSQGQTFDKVGLYLGCPVFCHGQLYVALSRVERKADVKIFCPRSSYQRYYALLKFPSFAVSDSSSTSFESSESEESSSLDESESDYGPQKIRVRNVIQEEVFRKVLG